MIPLSDRPYPRRTLFPFVMLIVFSLLFKPRHSDLAERFYAKMKTPVGRTPEDDAKTVALNQAEPQRVGYLKLFPRSNWEFTKWTRQDFLGFFGCWGVVGVILLILVTLLRAGS